jgi:hypothetical protein
MPASASAFFPLHTVHLEVGNNQLVVPPVEGLPIFRYWHVVHTHVKTLSPGAEAFRYFVLKEGERLIAGLFPELAAIGPRVRGPGSAPRAKR